MALPGSLYKNAKENKQFYLQTMRGIRFTLETVPLPTDKLKAYEVLKLRDEAFIKYHTNENFLNLIKKNLDYSCK